MTPPPDAASASPVIRFCGFMRTILSATWRGSGRPARCRPSSTQYWGRGRLRRKSPTTRPRAASSISSPFQSASPMLRAVGIEPDIPGQIDVAHLGERLDRHVDAEQMRDPARDRLAQRLQPAPPAGQIDRGVEQVAVLPIMMRIVVVHHVDFGLRRESRAWTRAAKPACRSRPKSSPRRRRSASLHARSCAAAGRRSRPRAAPAGPRSRRAHCAGSHARAD